MKRAFLVLASVLLSGCGPRPPAEEPKPTLEPAGAAEAEPSAPASSPGVKKGMDLIAAQKFAEAESVLGSARTEAPQDPQAAYYHGVALEGLGRGEDAKSAYEAALKLDPKLLEASQNLSALLVEMDQPSDALAVADGGLASYPENGGLLGNRALALGALGSPEAKAAFEKALSKRPDDGWLRYYFAAVLVLEKDRDRALSELKKIVVGDASLGTSVSELYGVLKDFPGCVSALDQAIQQEKAPSAELLVRRGRCKVGAKDMKGAESDFRAAVQAAPNEPIGHFYLGKHLWASGAKPEGKKELERARELGPETPFGKEAAEKLAGK
jgi:tetratricopeptide (TPR) repeat protein